MVYSLCDVVQIYCALVNFVFYVWKVVEWLICTCMYSTHRTPVYLYVHTPLCVEGLFTPSIVHTESHNYINQRSDQHCSLQYISHPICTYSIKCCSSTRLLKIEALYVARIPVGKHILKM